MKKSKRRVIAIITCCLVLATFCVGVFADETSQEEVIDPSMNRVGTVLYSEPFDIGENVHPVSTLMDYVYSDYYIVKFTYNVVPEDGVNITLFDSSNISGVLSNDTIYFKSSSDSGNYTIFGIEQGQSVYLYVYFRDIYFRYTDINSGGTYVSCEVYSIANRSVIDSVYVNSLDVNSSIVSVINEATNVITTNDVVMMFCILIPVISFGVGILIRLRKRS